MCVILALIVLMFAGLLLAMHYYVRGNLPAFRTEPTEAANQTDVGKEGIVNTTAFIRNAPSMTGDNVITTLEKGARVRVLSVSDDDKWYEVEAPSTNGSTNTVMRGWMGKKVIDLSSQSNRGLLVRLLDFKSVSQETIPMRRCPKGMMRSERACLRLKRARQFDREPKFGRMLIR